MKAEELTFGHAGDLGDLIYGLPTMMALGGGALRLRSRSFTRIPMTRERAMGISELLLLQPYVKSCLFLDGAVDINLDRWRELNTRSGINIAEMHLEVFGQGRIKALSPWMRVEQKVVGYPVIVHRSERYRNGLFPWGEVAKKYGDKIGVVGSPSEFEDLRKSFGLRNYVSTPSLLSLAEVIAGCSLFIGNQSAPLAIAEAVHVQVIQEAYPVHPNCVFRRPGSYAYLKGELKLPDV